MKIEENFVIDTNILVYYFNALSRFNEFSRNIINLNIRNLRIVQKSISEFVAVITKIGLDEIMENEFDKILDTYQILYPSDLSNKILSNLIKKYNPKGNKIYDYEIISVMLANNINKIATFNFDDFKRITEIELIIQ